MKYDNINERVNVGIAIFNTILVFILPNKLKQNIPSNFYDYATINDDPYILHKT
jgi:hypothetical protein